MTDYHILECPNCPPGTYIMIHKNEINCGIFRHGALKSPQGIGMQMPPHESKEICDKLKDEDKIYGCGKPFKYDAGKNTLVKCEYI